MSVTRRQFLLSTAGATVGAIIPSFYFRALEHFERFGEPLLVTPARVTEDLIVSNSNGYPELSLGDPCVGPPKMTFHEYYTRYWSGSLSEFMEGWGLEPPELATYIHEEYVWDKWCMKDSPAARAYFYLQSLDLGNALNGPEAVGGLDFLEESNMVGSWLAVSPRDEVTLSLLQQRLNDLGTGIRVVTGYQV